MFQLDKRVMTCITHVSASQITSQRFAPCCEINIHHLSIKDRFAGSVTQSVCFSLSLHIYDTIFKQQQQK